MSRIAQARQRAPEARAAPEAALPDGGAGAARRAETSGSSAAPRPAESGDAHDPALRLFLPPGRRHHRGLPARRPAGALDRPAAGGGRDDRRRDARAVAVRAVLPRAPARPVPQGNAGHALRRRAARRRPVHVPGRPRVPGRPLPEPRRSAAAVSAAGILVPFVLGLRAHAVAARVPGLFSPGHSRWRPRCSSGAASPSPPFPMLARIIHERGLAGTSLGTLALDGGRGRRRGGLVHPGGGAGDLRRRAGAVPVPRSAAAWPTRRSWSRRAAAARTGCGAVRRARGAS